MQYLDGKKLQLKIFDEIKNIVCLLEIKPTLAVISVGDDSVNKVFLKQIKKMCAYVGYELEYYHYEDVSLETFRTLIQKLNERNKVHAILILRPLLKHLPALEINNLILPTKDIDGVTDRNRIQFQNGEGGFISGTSLGIIRLLEEYQVDIHEKNVVIVNRSREIGQSLFYHFLRHDCTVTLCHSRTKNVKEYIKKADIVITAIGKAKYFSIHDFKENSIVIDVGLECLEGHLMGDVEVVDTKMSNCCLVQAIGGVGPMTIAALAENILKSYYFTRGR